MESRFFEQSYLEKIDLNEPENLQIKLALRSLLGYLEYTQKVVAEFECYSLGIPKSLFET